MMREAFDLMEKFSDSSYPCEAHKGEQKVPGLDGGNPAMA